MNIFTQKLNVAKLYFQADKKRVAAAVLLFALAIGSSWASLVPQTLADDYGYYYGGDSGYSDYGYSDYSYSSPSYDYSYGSTPSYSYDYSTPSYSYDYSSYSTPSYSYTYNGTPSSSYDYSSYSTPSYSYDYNYPSYSGYSSYEYAYPSYGYSDYAYSYPYYNGYGKYSDTLYDSNYTYNDSYTYTDYYGGYGGSCDTCYYPCYSCGTSTPSITAVDLNITKTVKNISANDTSWVKSTNANAGDRIAFSITINNNSNSPAYNVVVSDTLPSQLSYVSGSTRIDNNGSSSDGITSNGINIGTLDSGQSKTITFNTDLQYYAPYNYDYTITNYAYVRADNISQKSDSAQIHLGGTNSSNANLSVNKRTRNASKGEGLWQESTNANPGDRIVFEIRVRTNNINANTYAYNVVVWDNLPYNIVYNTGSTRIDGNYASDGIVSGGIFLGNLSSSQEKIIIIEATLQSGSGFYYDVNTLTNTAYAKADNLGQVSDTAQVVVSGQGQPSVNVSNLRKTVQNTSAPNGTDTDNTASSGDTLRYTFTYANNGNTTLNNVRIIDDLPSYLSVQNADNNGVYDERTNQTTWSLGTIYAGNSRTVSYLAKITNVPNSTVIRNTGIVRADNTADITSNEVKTTINIPGTAPTTPTIVKAVTGANSLSIFTSLLLGLLSASGLYLVSQNSPKFTKFRLAIKTFKIRIKDKIKI